MGNKKVEIIIPAILGFVVLVIGVPLGINASYQSEIVIIRTQWGAEAVLGYYGALLSSVVTIAGLAVTIQFTRKQIQRESYLKSETEKWAKIEAVITNILNEVNPIPTLKQVMDTGFTDPSKAISSLQKYQMTCRSATDLLCAYINSVDYAKVKELVDHIADVAEKFFQASQKEVEQYKRFQQWQLRDSTLKLLAMAGNHPGGLPVEDLAKHRGIIENTVGICLEDIENELGQLNEEIIRIYETDFRSLLQMKGATFEAIGLQTQSNADAILSLRLK